MIAKLGLMGNVKELLGTTSLSLKVKNWKQADSKGESFCIEYIVVAVADMGFCIFL